MLQALFLSLETISAGTPSYAPTIVLINDTAGPLCQPDSNGYNVWMASWYSGSCWWQSYRSDGLGSGQSTTFSPWDPSCGWDNGAGCSNPGAFGWGYWPCHYEGNPTISGCYGGVIRLSQIIQSIPGYQTNACIMSTLTNFAIPSRTIVDKNNGPRRVHDSGCGMPVWQVSEPYISLWLDDEPLAYTPALGGPIALQLSFKQRESEIGFDPATFSVGKRWNCSWVSYVSTDQNGAGIVSFPGGGQRKYSGSNLDFLTYTRLTGSTNTGFTLAFPDGGTNQYRFLLTNASGVFLKAFLTETITPQAQFTRYIYAPYDNTYPTVRLLYVVDGDGRTNSIQYVSTNGFSTNLISQVTDAFGRYCTMLYDESGRLTNITDVVGLSSSLIYNNADCVTNLITPYGTTRFDITESTNASPSGRAILVTEPDGERQLFLNKDFALGVGNSYPATDVPSLPSNSGFVAYFDNMYRSVDNTFHWGRLEYTALSTTNIAQFTANDFRKARMRHWLLEGANQISEVLAFERAPSQDYSGATEGQKTWYDYQGKTNIINIGSHSLPQTIATLLPDGTTSFVRTDRNLYGLPKAEVSSYTLASSVALRTNTYTYATNGIDLLRVTNSAGVQVLNNTYNTFHQVLTNLNALNEKTTFAYNTNQQLTSVSTPAGLLTTNIHFVSGTDANRLAATFEFSGSDTYRSNSFAYHGNGLLYSRTDERGLTTYTFWDNLQRLVSTWYPDLTTISNCYTALDLTATKDRLGYWTQYNYDSLRHLTNLANANGVISRYTYCACGSLSSETKALGTSVEQSTTYGYDLQGNRTYEYLPDNTITNWYDALGRVSVTGDGWGYRWFFYNNQGLLSTVSNSFGLEKQIIYDILDRPQYVTDQNGVTITNTYDALGRLRTRGYPDGGVERFGYSARGITAYTNQIGAATYYGYNAAGWKLFETNANNEYLEYRYDSSGNLTNLIDGKRQVTAWRYDEYSRPTNKLDQSGAVAFRYTYNAANRLVDRWTPAKGDTVYVYDPVGNLTNKYSANSAVVFGYDPLNRLSTMLDAVGTTTFSYTPGGRLLTEDGPFDNDTVTNIYTAALRTGLTLQQPSGLWTNSFGYDAMGRLTNVASPAGAFLYGFQSQGSTLISQLGLPNTSYITNTFDSVGRLTSTSLKNSSGVTLDSAVYGLNLAGQRLAFTNAAGTYVQYGYDNIGQLKVADSSLDTEDRGYACDAAWNILSRTNNGVCTSYSVNGLNEVTGDGTYAISYDANGNIGTMYSVASYLSFTFDDDNQLVRVYDALNSSFRTDFIYDGLGRLRGRLEYTNFMEEGRPSGLDLPASWALASETLYIYDGNRLIQERDAYNTPTVSYTRGADLSGTLEGAGGIGGLLARSAGGSHAYYHADGGGNITALVNGSQTLVAAYRYDPFGNLLSSIGSLAGDNVYRFSSKEFHAPSGLYYYGKRWYSPYLQRWLTQDPAEESGGVNLYGFVGNDPMSLFDPFGLTPSLNELFWLSVYENGRSDAGRFLSRLASNGGNAALAMASQALRAQFDPIGLAYSQYQSVAGLGSYLGELSGDPCARQRALRSLGEYASSPEASADATFFVESILAGRLLGPAAPSQAAAEGGIRVVNVGGPLDGVVSSRSLASDFLNVELKAPPAGVPYPATVVGDFNTMDLSAVAGNSVRTIRASKVPFVPVPGGYVVPEALASQATTVGASRIVVSTGSRSVAPLVEGLASSGWTPVVRNIGGRIIVTATPK